MTRFNKILLAIRALSLGGVFGISLAGAASATSPKATTPALDPGVALLEQVAHGQLSVEKTIPVSKTLVAYLVAATPSGGASAQASQKMIVFVADGQYIIAGNVINASGESLTSELTSKYITQVTAKSAYLEAANTTWFAQGSDAAPHKVYIVIDPNCIFCHMIYQELAPMIADQQLQVRWIPVGFLKPDSMGKAVALLTAKDPAEAFKQDEASFNTQTEEGGLTPVSDNAQDPAISAAYVKVGLNTQFFSKNGFQGTPTLLYKDQKGQPDFYPGYAKGPQLKALIENMGNQF